jgi:hypothetical protein
MKYRHYVLDKGYLENSNAHSRASLVVQYTAGKLAKERDFTSVQCIRFNNVSASYSRYFPFKTYHLDTPSWSNTQSTRYPQQISPKKETLTMRISNAGRILQRRATTIAKHGIYSILTSCQPPTLHVHLLERDSPNIITLLLHY